jgi:4'-phosphopantetheinyl transferase
MTFPPQERTGAGPRLVTDPADASAALTLDLWLWPLATDAARQAGLGRHLSPQERARAARYRAPEAGAAYVAARGRMREVLAGYTGRAPAEVPLVQDRQGKPHLDEGASGTGPAFNLSHAGGWAALVVGPHGLALGIDIEPHRPVPDGLPERWLSPAERAELAPLAGPLRIAGFFNAWTRKEALLKALGAGLSRPLDSFDVTLAPGRPARLAHLSGARADRWQLIAFDLRPDFPACIALRHAGPVALSLREGALPLPEAHTGETPPPAKP